MSSSNQLPDIAPRYSVRLFGALFVEKRSGLTRHVNIPAGRPQSLLGYLLLHRGRPIARAQVTATLWQGADENRARRALSDTLYRLRKALGEEWMRMDGDMLAISPDLDLTVDIWDFEEAIHQGEPNALAKAISLYQGELLAGLNEDWLLAPRLAFQESYLDAVETLARQAEEERNLGQAALYYRQLIQAEPYREAGYVGLMRVLAARHRLREALQVYEQLEQVLVREIHVRPSDYARELAAQLQAEAELWSAPKEVVEPLYRLPFVGRLAERALALQQIEGLDKGRGGILLVEAESGMGKSRLLQHLSESARWRSVWALSVVFPSEPDANPYTPLIQALEPVWSSSRAPQLAATLSPAGMAALGPLSPDWHPRAEPFTLPAEDALTFMIQAWLELVRALCDAAPCLLVLDDVHWATSSIWDLLDALAPHLADLPCLLVLAYRRQELHGKPAWSRIQRWEALAPLHMIELHPLEMEDVARLWPSESDLDAKEVLAVTGGNPLYIQQLLASGLRSGQGLPAVLEARLQALPTEIRQSLHAAAVLGEHIPFSVWRDLTHASYAHLTAVADTLVARGWLTVQGNAYRFAHSTLRQAALADLSDDQRKAYHSRAADLLTAEPAPKRIYAVARHLDQAGRSQEAAHAYLSVARDAQSIHAYAEARDAYQRALALLDPAEDDLHKDLLRGLAQVLPVTGEWDEQDKVLDRLDDLARATGDRALQRETAIHRARNAFRAGQYEEALAMLGQAEPGAVDDRDGHLQIALLRGDIYLRVNQYDSARLHLEEARILALALGRRAEEGRALDGLAWVGSQQGEDTETVLALYRQALDAQRAAGDRLGEARTWLNMLTVQANAGHWDQVVQLAEEVLAAQHSVHYSLGESVTHQTLATTYAALGVYKQAMDHAERALAGFRSVNEQAGAVIALETRGVIAARRGELAQAEADLRQAMAQAETLGLPTFVAFAQQDLAALLYEDGRIGEAIPLLENAHSHWNEIEDTLNLVRCEALLGLSHMKQGNETQARMLAERGWSLFQKGPPGGEDMQTWLLWLSQLCLELGQTEESHSLIRASYAELQRQARAIQDHEVRARFFYAVSVNRAIVAAHDQATGVVRQQQVTMARIGAPPSRLTPEQQVTVTWTVLGPEDETIQDARIRRHVALQRLLRAAANQGGAPTDQELAQALGVSRRTILRDMEHLAQAGVEISTRRR